MSRINARRDPQVLGDALHSIERLLPASWRLLREVAPADVPADALVSLVGPGEERAAFCVEARPSGCPVGQLLPALREQRRQVGLPLLFVSDYIGPALRAALEEDGMSYADSSGWVRILSEGPLVLLTGQGASTSPRAGTPSAIIRLDGVAVSRIVRALCEHDAPLGVRELAGIAGVSPGSVSKLLPTLANEGVVERVAGGGVTGVDRRALVERWARDYSFAGSNHAVTHLVAPHGMERILAQRRSIPVRTALTGSEAAHRLLPGGEEPALPLRLLALYAESVTAAADALGLLPCEPADADVVLAVPQDDAVLAQDLAPTALILADLLTLRSWGRAEAEQLMDVLAERAAGWSV
ncbi:helix-turn-helix domain-containing protein [Brachybacterium sp. DNPG3]